MWSKIHPASALIALLLSAAGGCTPLVVARDGHSVIVATNSKDTDGNSHCKLHFAKNAVVMRSTQAASMKFIWPDGRVEVMDFDADLNERIRDLDEPVDRMKEILIADSERRIISILQRYRPASRERREIARDLVSEYVIVGKEHNGFLGVRAFTLEVIDPRDITFNVRDLRNSIHDGQVIDYSEGDVVAHEREGAKATIGTIYSILQGRTQSAEISGNKAFSPPYLIMKVTHSGRYFLSDAGPCRI